MCPCVDKLELALVDTEMVVVEGCCSLEVVPFGYSCCCNSNSIVGCSWADSLALHLVADVHTAELERHWASVVEHERLGCTHSWASNRSVDVGNAVEPFVDVDALELLVQRLDDDNCPRCNNSSLLVVVVVVVGLEVPFVHKPDFDIGCRYCSIDWVVD